MAQSTENVKEVVNSLDVKNDTANPSNDRGYNRKK